MPVTLSVKSDISKCNNNTVPMKSGKGGGGEGGEEVKVE